MDIEIPRIRRAYSRLPGWLIFCRFLCKRLGVKRGLIYDKGAYLFLSGGLCPGISPEPDYAAAATGGAPTLPVGRALPQSPRSVFQNLRVHWTPPNRTPDRTEAFTLKNISVSIIQSKKIRR